jgi:hypothetical protein
MKAKLSLLVGLAALAGAAVSLANVAQAYPTSCVIRTYYRTAEMVDVVGVRTKCPGGRSWGRTTRFVEAERVDLTPPGPGGTSGSPGKLPCEFLATGCPVIQGPRYQ